MSDESHGSERPGPATELHFRAVTIRTLGDFASFRQAHAAFGSCSCMRWRMRGEEFAHSPGRAHAHAFDSLVQTGTPVGILAYVDNVPVGWCSVAPRETFPTLDARASIAAVDDARTWSVTCLYVEPRYRRQGIALRLLRAAVEYARAEGAHAVEGYPVQPGGRSPPHLGSASMFRRAGFRDATPPGRKRRIMRNVVA